jgi:4-hydroxybenzoate polyprenyltransferase
MMTLLLRTASSDQLVELPLTAPQNRSVVEILRLAFEEARPAVLGIFALRYASAVALALTAEGTPHIAQAVVRASAGLFVWTCAVGFVYLLNGTSDVTEDRINGSQRPIARGDLPIAHARVVLASLSAAALGVGVLCGARIFVAAAALIVLGYLYSGAPFRLKRHPSAAAAILILAGLLTYVAGWTDVTAARPDAAVAALAVVMALWMGLVGAVAKDFADVTGDAAAGCKLGLDRRCDIARRTRCAMAALALGAFALVGGLAEWPALRWAGIALAAGALVVVHQCIVTVDAPARGTLRRPYRAFMVTQYGVHLSAVVGILAGYLAR